MPMGGKKIASLQVESGFFTELWKVSFFYDPC